MRQFSLEEYLANPSKKVVTRNGRNVKIHCTNCVGTHPVVAEIEGSGESILFTEKGELCVGYDLKKDLFFATEKHEGWINLYLDFNHTTYSPGACIYESKESAEKAGKTAKNYIATAKMEWEG